MASSLSDRGATWGREETARLLEIWAEQRVQDMLNGSRRNIDVYQVISHELNTGRETDSPARTAEQCRSKIKGLKEKYHSLKKDNRKSGSGLNTFPDYEIIDSVLCHCPSTAPSYSLDTSTPTPGTSAVDVWQRLPGRLGRRWSFSLSLQTR